MRLSKNESMYLSVQKVEWQSIDSTDGSSVKTTPFRSSKLILKIPENVRQIYSILSKEVTSFILYTLRFLQKKLPSGWPRQSFCCWKASDRFLSPWWRSAPWLPKWYPDEFHNDKPLWPRYVLPHRYSVPTSCPDTAAVQPAAGWIPWVPTGITGMPLRCLPRCAVWEIDKANPDSCWPSDVSSAWLRG